MATRLSDDLKEQPWVDVLKTLGEELRTFIQQEMQLVKVELGSKVKQAGMGAGMFGAAGFLGFLSVGALTAAVILALALVVPAWAAALIVGAFYGLVAALLALSGKKKVKAATPLAPEQALRTVQATRAQVQQAWERGSHQAGTANSSSSSRGPAGWTAPELAPDAGETSSPPGPPEEVVKEQPPPPMGTASFRPSPPRY
jgi:hypothetical protein